MLTLLGWLCVTAALYFLFYRQEQGEKQRALRHMAARPSFGPEEFGRRYFSADQAAIASQVIQIFARHIDLDVSGAHPDDRLVEDLRMDALDSLSTVEMVLDLEKHFRISIPDAAAANMHTLRDITDFVSRTLPPHQCR